MIHRNGWSEHHLRSARTRQTFLAPDFWFLYFAVLLRRMPTPSISTSTTSPAFIGFVVPGVTPETGRFMAMLGRAPSFVAEVGTRRFLFQSEHERDEHLRVLQMGSIRSAEVSNVFHFLSLRRSQQ